MTTSSVPNRIPIYSTPEILIEIKPSTPGAIIHTSFNIIIYLKLCCGIHTVKS